MTLFHKIVVFHKNNAYTPYNSKNNNKTTYRTTEIKVQNTNFVLG